MATTTRVTLFRRGKFWYLNYWLDGRRHRVPTGLVSKMEAELLRADKEKSLVLDQLHHLRRQDIPVARCYREYLRQCQANFLAKKTLDTARSTLKKFFRWAAVRTIDRLTTGRVMDYFAYRVKSDHLEPASLRRNREALHAFFNFVKRKGYVGTNPVSEVKPPRVPESDIRYLKLGEIAGCLKAVKGDRLEPVIACAIYAGLRREEICWLTWEDVDLTEGKPLLRVRLKEVDGHRWIPKTKRNRFVPIHPYLLPYLQAMKLQSGEVPWVFASPQGCRWDGDNLGHALAKRMRLLGLKWNFLDFRHTYGSQLAMKGLTIYKIAKLMGNSSRVAERHYAALQTEDLHKDINFGVEEAPVVKKPARRKEGDASSTGGRS
jgi:integrase